MACLGSAPTFFALELIATLSGVTVTGTIDVTGDGTGRNYTVGVYRKKGSVPTFAPEDTRVASISIPDLLSGPGVINWSDTLSEAGTFYYKARIECEHSSFGGADESVAVSVELTHYINSGIGTSSNVTSWTTTPQDRPQTAIPHEGVDELIVLAKPTGTPGGGVTYTEQTILSRSYQRMEWEYLRLGGCGRFRLLLRESFSNLQTAVEDGWEIWVKIKLAGESDYTVWYRGVIKSVTADFSGSEVLADVQGWGYIEQLNKIYVQKRYPKGLTVKDVVKDIVKEIVNPYSRIEYDETLIDASSYTLTDELHFECTALRAIKFLAQLQGDREWGVDAERKFYFKQESSIVNTTFFGNRDGIGIRQGARTNASINQIKVEGKHYGSREHLTIRGDITDITQRGLHEVAIELPWVAGAQEATRWADNVIAGRKGRRDWREMTWQGVDARLEGTKPMPKIQYRDTGEDAASFEIHKVKSIHYTKGGFKQKGEIREIGRSVQQAEMDSPVIRAKIYLGDAPDDAIATIEKIVDQVEALKGKQKQIRIPRDVTLWKDVTRANVRDVSARWGKGELAYMYPDVTHPSYLNDVTNLDITNNPTELHDLTNPRGVLTAWVDNQWTKVGLRRSFNTLPARGKYIGEVATLITDVTNQEYGDLYFWSGTAWHRLINSTGSPGDVVINDHGALTSLGDDDHLQYLLLAGRSGGQTAYGGTGSGDDLYLRSTSHVTKGDVLIADDGGRVGIGSATVFAAGRLTVNGADGTLATGPHSHWMTTADAYPLLQILPWSHNNVNISFDAYFDGAWRAASNAVNWSIQKSGNALVVFGASAAPAAGSTITWVNRLHFNSTTELVVNDDGANYDFRIEGDTNANLFFIDASTDRVGIGTNGPGTTLHVFSATTATNARIQCQLAGSAATLELWGDTATTGYEIRFKREGTDRWYIYAPAGDTNLYFRDMVSARMVMTFVQSSVGVIFNDDGADQDFRIEGDTNVNLFFVDASTDAVILGGNSPSSSARLTIHKDATNATANGFGLYGAWIASSSGTYYHRTQDIDATTNSYVATGVTNSGYVIGQWIQTLRSNASEDGTLSAMTSTHYSIGHWSTVGANTTTTTLFGVEIVMYGYVGTIGTTTGCSFSATTGGGTLTTIYGFASTVTVGTNKYAYYANSTGFAFYSVAGVSVFNENGGDYDFRVEGDTRTHLVFVDASADFVSIGGSSPFCLLHVEDLVANNTNSKNILALTANESDESGSYAYDASKPTFGLIYRRNWTSGTYTTLARIDCYGSAGWRGGLAFFTKVDNTSGGSPALVMEIRPDGGVNCRPSSNTGGGFVWNENGVDSDFRVEGDANANLLFVDASIDSVLVGGSAAANNARLVIIDGGMAQSYMLYIDCDDANPWYIAFHNDTYGSNDHRWYMSNTGQLIWYSPTANEVFVVNANGAITVNENGNDADFRVEGDTDANLFFLDASTDRIGIGIASPNAKLEVKAASGSSMALVLSSTDTPQQVNLEFWDGSSAKWALLKNSSHGFIVHDYVRGAEVMTFYSNGAAVFNDSGADLDFRIEGDTKANLLLVDASVDEISFDASVAYRASTPSQITSNQNNYAIGIGRFIRLSTDASRTITGIAGGTNGRELVIRNVGSFDLVLANENGGSTASNRISTNTGADLTVPAGAIVVLIYDSTSSRWIVW